MPIALAVAALLAVQTPDGGPVDASPATAPTAATTDDAAPVEEAPRVLVLAPAGDALDASARASVASLVARELDELDGVEVISASDVQRLAELEAEKQSLGCDDAGACLAEIAGAMGARFVVFGDVAALGDVRVVNLSLYDARDGRAVGRATLEVRALEDLPRRVPAAARALVVGVPAFAGKSFAPEPGPPLWAIAGTASLVGAGAIVAGLGVAYDLLAPSSDDGAVDALDFVGPAALVVGAGAIAGGAALLVLAPPDP